MARHKPQQSQPQANLAVREPIRALTRHSADGVYEVTPEMAIAVLTGVYTGSAANRLSPYEIKAVSALPQARDWGAAQGMIDSLALLLTGTVASQEIPALLSGVKSELVDHSVPHAGVNGFAAPEAKDEGRANIPVGPALADTAREAVAHSRGGRKRGRPSKADQENEKRAAQALADAAVVFKVKKSYEPIKDFFTDEFLLRGQRRLFTGRCHALFDVCDQLKIDQAGPRQFKMAC